MDSVDSTSVEKDSFSEGGFTRIDMCRDTDVSQRVGIRGEEDGMGEKGVVEIRKLSSRLLTDKSVCESCKAQHFLFGFWIYCIVCKNRIWP